MCQWGSEWVCVIACKDFVSIKWTLYMVHCSMRQHSDVHPPSAFGTSNSFTESLHFFRLWACMHFCSVAVWPSLVADIYLNPGCIYSRSIYECSLWLWFTTKNTITECRGCFGPSMQSSHSRRNQFIWVTFCLWQWWSSFSFGQNRFRWVASPFNVLMSKRLHRDVVNSELLKCN